MKKYVLLACLLTSTTFVSAASVEVSKEVAPSATEVLLKGSEERKDETSFASIEVSKEVAPSATEAVLKEREEKKEVVTTAYICNFKVNGEVIPVPMPNQFSDSVNALLCGIVQLLVDLGFTPG